MNNLAIINTVSISLYILCRMYNATYQPQTSKDAQKRLLGKGNVVRCVLLQSASAFQIFECLLPFLDRHCVQELLEAFHPTFLVGTKKGSNIESRTL